MLSRAVPGLVLVVLGALALVAGAVEARFDQAAATPGAATPAPATPIVAGTPPATPVAGRTVEIIGYDYIHAGVEVAVGATVTWVNEDGRPHTVTAAAGAFDSGAMHRGSRFAHTFTDPGSYRYECDYLLNMSGVILVDD